MAVSRGAVALVAAATLACATLVAGAPPASAAPTVSVSTVQYDSPGGTVPAIVTVDAVPTGYTASITAAGTNGSTVVCDGDVWFNPHRATASRKCYLQMPGRTGLFNVTGTATLTKPGAPTLTAVGTGARPVQARGYPTATPMSLDGIRRVERCHSTTDSVWLTFDDGGSATQVRTILATLKRNDVKGRFFFLGSWAASNPALVSEIRADGHLLANHSYDHPALSDIADAEVLRQIDRGLGATTTPRLLRPPYGAGALTTRLEALAAARGYKVCRWTTDTYDWDGSSAAVMVERITYGDRRTPPVRAGGNILMHGTGANTGSGLQAVIDAVRAKGLRLEPLRPGTSPGGGARHSDFTADGHPDVLATTADGDLHLYPGDGAGGWGRYGRVGVGWQVMTAIVTVGDVTGDGHGDVYARDGSGRLWLYPGNGVGGWRDRRQVGSGWNGFDTLLAAGDWNGDGLPDVIARHGNGSLYLYASSPGGGLTPGRVIGTGWGSFTALVGSGDFSGDGRADILARDSSGRLLMYRGNGTGFVGSAVVGTGWGAFTSLLSVGDLTGDRRPDVLARDAAGRLLLYPGNGTGGWLPGRQIGTGWGAFTRLH